MADIHQQIDMTAVESKDILANRQHGWDFFLRAVSWGIGAVILLLVALYLLFG